MTYYDINMCNEYLETHCELSEVNTVALDEAMHACRYWDIMAYARMQK